MKELSNIKKAIKLSEKKEKKLSAKSTKSSEKSSVKSSEKSSDKSSERSLISADISNCKILIPEGIEGNNELQSLINLNNKLTEKELKPKQDKSKCMSKFVCYIIFINIH